MNKQDQHSKYYKELSMKSFFIVIITSLILLITNDTYSQIGGSLNKTGTTAAQFLKIGVGPRPIGMGGAFTASADDINSIYWNPAGLAGMYTREAYFNHVDWISDVKLDYAGFGIEVPGFGTLGASVSLLSMGTMLEPLSSLKVPVNILMPDHFYLD